MDPDKRRMTIPGTGGYEIKWAPGAIHIPLVPAMSSHLMMPCSEFEKVQTNGLAPSNVTLHAVDSNAPAADDGDLPDLVDSGAGSSWQ
mgnify:CR=1 FL=1